MIMNKMATSSSYQHISAPSVRGRTILFFRHYHQLSRHKHSTLLTNRSRLSFSQPAPIPFDLSHTCSQCTESGPISSCHGHSHQKYDGIVEEGRQHRGLKEEGSGPESSIFSPANRSGQEKLTNMFSLPSRFLLPDLFRVKGNNVQLVDSEICSSSDRLPDLCSYLDCQQSQVKSLKIAPFIFRTLSSEAVPLYRGSSETNANMPSVGQVKANSSTPGKGGDGSWKEFCEGIKVSSSNSEEKGNKSSASGSKPIIHNDFIKSLGPWGRKAMAMTLLLDPIVGSPPSNFTSPTVEARDDISALSEGFTRKVKLLRRRLSTSFDEPTSSDHVGGRGGSVYSNAGNHANVEHVGPFGLKSVPKNRTAQVEEDNAEKKAKLNSWLTKVHEEALVKSRRGSGDSGESGADGAAKGYSDDDDNGDNSSRSSSRASKITEDLFQLLEKVIGFKGRNISHITVEQSVKDLCTVYIDATDEEKLQFFSILAQKYGVDHDYVTNAATNLASCKDSDVRLTLEEKLRGALVPKSQWLFTQIGRLENGVKFLVDLRTDLLDAIEKAQEKSSLKALNNSLRDLIGMWFNVGFLNLERVTWQSSCDMLQKVSEYEAVHPMRNWTDLKKRVGPNRRCFVFTHNSMPSEPVVVLHTFLTDHIPSSVQKIVANHRMRMMSLDNDLPLSSTAEDPDSINTAAFYSITSTQRGLTGIELGNYLIKRVVRELQKEFPKMTQFSSLSPIPGFKNWLVGSIRTVMKDPNQTLLTEKEIAGLKPMFAKHGEGKDFYEVFLDLLKVNSWFSDERLVKELEHPLMRLCAQYLYITKRRGYALDPVGHFHLKNGAVMWRLNWLGDNSPRGLGQSCGMMVNYRYFLDDCETNSQNYMENQVIHISDHVKHLVKLTDPSSTLVHKL